jgi:DNA-binding transcriptional regulator YdaS (Cro superfamily)
MSKDALLKAIEVLGSQTALAAVCGGPVKQGHVYYWLNTSKRGLPPEYCEKVEIATRSKGDEVSRYRLRADVFGPEPQAIPEAA